MGSSWQKNQDDGKIHETRNEKVVLSYIIILLPIHNF